MPLSTSYNMAVNTARHFPPGDDHADKPVIWGEIPATQLDPAKTSSETSNEETMRSASSLDIRNHESDGEGVSRIQIGNRGKKARFSY